MFGLFENNPQFLIVESVEAGARLYNGISPVSVSNDENAIALNILANSDWNGLLDGFEGLDLNFTVLDRCSGDANSVWTSANNCQDITSFDTGGVGGGDDTFNVLSSVIPWVDANVSDAITLTNITQITNRAFSALSDRNFSLLSLDDNSSFDARYLPHQLRTYIGISPITADSDSNQIGLNVLSTSDWNGTFDGNDSTFFIDWTNSVNRNFSLLSLDDNSSFDGRYNLTVDTNTPGRIDFSVIANHPAAGGDINSNNGFVVGVTSNAITPDLNFGGFAGYKAANFLCDSNFGDSHLCTVDEVIDTIRTEDFSSLIGETAWVTEGAPGFTVEANDCGGYTSKTATSLGSFWNFIDAEDSGGKSSLTACSGERKLVCCR